MVMSSARRKTLCKFASPVLGRGTPRFLNQLEHWLEHKGEEWLSERWKALRNAAILVRSGSPEDAIALMEEKGIAVRKDKPVSQGEFGRMQLAYIEAQSPYQLRTCEALLRGYTALTLDSESKKQVAKARKAITVPSQDQSLVNSKKMESLVTGFQILPRRASLGYSPDARGISGIKSYYSGYIQVPGKVKRLPFASAVVSALTVGYVPNSVIRLCGEHPIRRKAEMFQQSQNLPSTCGKVAFLQEGGCKARVICLPSFWVQAYYKPLQDDLIRMIGDVETPVVQKHMLGISCVLDQNRGAYAMQSWMKESREIFSYDLSSATDRFPLSLQLAYLEKSGKGEWTDSVHDVARSDFYVPSKDERWKYQVGQPMGIVFSFPLFHLTHLNLIESLAKVCCAKKTAPHYAVLGDDVLIADKGLAHAYREVISDLGVEISSEKSLEGVDVQSFAGFSGVSTSRGIQVFRPFKHGVDFALEGRELNLLSTFGPKVRKWSGWWSRSFDRLNRTYPLRNPDLSPILVEQNIDCRSGDPDSRWFSAITQRVLNEEVVIRIPLPKGRVAKFPTELGFLGEVDWNRSWASLLQEESAQLRNSFSPASYVEKERRSVRTNQISQDPLIKDLKREEEIQLHLSNLDKTGKVSRNPRQRSVNSR